MTTRTVLLTLHIISVTGWLGADILQYAVVPRLHREGPAVQLAWARQEHWLHSRYYGIVVLFILATGVGLVLDGDWSWSAWFVLVGLGTVVAGGLLGGVGLKGLAAKRVAALESGDTAAAEATRRTMLPVQLLTTALPALTVLAMVKRWHP